MEEVKKTNRSVPFRPSLNDIGAEEYVKSCIKACWHEEPDQRPDIRYVRVRLKEMQVRRLTFKAAKESPRVSNFQAGLKPNIFDNMLAIMEKYAYNLEGIVQERTNQLTEEKKKTEALLHRMLPK